MAQFSLDAPDVVSHLYDTNIQCLYHLIKNSLHTVLLASTLSILCAVTWCMQTLFFHVGMLLLFALTAYYILRPKPVYLVDFSCFHPPSTLRGSFATFLEHSKLSGCFDKRSLEFQKIILERSGLGEQTSLPESLHYLPPVTTLHAARKEAEMVLFDALDRLFSTTKVQPKDVSILVVNCSLFTPIPSLCSMIINRYKMRSNIQSFNLSGMGCSAGLISLSTAKDLLQVHTNTYALVVSTENITQNWYFGNQRSMLLPNCLFRVGGAALLLSNKRVKYRSKYELLHVVRTHKGADDRAYGCVFQEPDSNGEIGVRLSKDLMAVAGDALKGNITVLGPLVLPYSEQMAFVSNLLIKKLRDSRIKPYIPNFKLAFEHFCIHAGGRAVMDELEKSLSLSPQDVEASRMVLHRFGNTSSSSIWYELAYLEAKGRMKKGDRVWQIAFGSGFKCNSAVWKALRKVKEMENNPWKDTIDAYPVHTAEIHRL